MKRYIIIGILFVTMLSSSGCVLGLAAAIRWDQRRWKKMQEEQKQKEQEENKSDTE